MNSPIFVAEVSSNHNQDLQRCCQFIDTARQIGCDAVKFQLFRIKELFVPEILAKSEEHRRRQEWELPLKYLPALAAYTHDAGLQFSCTPFYLQAVEELLPYVDFYKIASYELLWDDLLRACARTGKPVALSTGMATLDEVRQAVTVLQGAGLRDLTLLHCVSSYPTPHKETNLAAIETLRQACQCPVGWSDHSIHPGIIYRAAHHWKASMIEFHLDLDRQGAEYSVGHCWLPEAIQAVIETVRIGFHSDGNGEKTPTPSELADRDWRAAPSDGLRPLPDIRKQWT